MDRNRRRDAVAGIAAAGLLALGAAVAFPATAAADPPPPHPLPPPGEPPPPPPPRPPLPTLPPLTPCPCRENPRLRLPPGRRCRYSAHHLDRLGLTCWCRTGYRQMMSRAHSARLRSSGLTGRPCSDNFRLPRHRAPIQE